MNGKKTGGLKKGRQIVGAIKAEVIFNGDDVQHEERIISHT